MRDEFKRIRDDAATLTDFLDDCALIELDETNARWMLQTVDRFHTNIGDALGRINKLLQSEPGQHRDSIQSREGTIRSANANEEQIPTEQNSSLSERNELLLRQQPNDSAQGSSTFDGRESREEASEKEREEKGNVKTDPDYIL